MCVCVCVCVNLCLRQETFQAELLTVLTVKPTMMLECISRGQCKRLLEGAHTHTHTFIYISVCECVLMYI